LTSFHRPSGRNGSLVDAVNVFVDIDALTILNPLAAGWQRSPERACDGAAPTAAGKLPSTKRTQTVSSGGPVHRSDLSSACCGVSRGGRARVMGHAIATRLTQQLGALVVSDLRPEFATDLVEAGAGFCDTAANAARTPQRHNRFSSSWVPADAGSPPSRVCGARFANREARTPRIPIRCTGTYARRYLLPAKERLTGPMHAVQRCSVCGAAPDLLRGGLA
jgi:hypothetical protein